MLKRLKYLTRMKAPLVVLICNLRDRINRSGIFTSARISARDAFLDSTKSGHFTTDWFSENIVWWISAFEKTGIGQHLPIRALEVGSWEGMSSVFMLDHFPNMQLLCVDTWCGADEHHQDARWQPLLSDVERRFDANVKNFGKRVSKFKGTSQAYFSDLPPSQTFDIIYVDGSHFSDDVLCDAVSAWAHLAPGGVLILDDYLWREYCQETCNPAWAINAFLRYIDEYVVIHAYHQMILQKPIPTATPAQRHLIKEQL